ncbi:MAG: hypothetical protein AAFO07_19990 [Bacteroidota bacterium]
MAIRDIDELLRHFEQGATDELHLLESTGAEFYSTHQLLRLYGQWEIKNQLFKRFQKLLMQIAAFSPVWIVLFLLLDLIGWKFISLLMLSFFPISFVLFFVGLVFMRKFFKGKGHLNKVGEMIVEAIKSRQ